MLKNFNWEAMSRTRLTLLGVMIALLGFNLGAVYFYLDPPGGTRKELRAQSESLRVQLRTEALKTQRFERVADRVQSGSIEARDFAGHYFLPRRQAYDAVISDLQRMAKESNLTWREAAYTEEAVEGSDDLNVLNVTANFEGPYDDLMKFLYQVDKSPALIILDTLQAAPQQHGQVVNTSIRFQTIVRDEEGVQQ